VTVSSTTTGRTEVFVPGGEDGEGDEFRPAELIYNSNVKTADVEAGTKYKKQDSPDS
jgi:hypothetical protein